MNIPFINPPTVEQQLADQRWAAFDALRQDNSARLARYRLFEEEYRRPRDADLGVHVNGDYGRYPVDADHQKRHAIPMPYAHPIIQKHAHRIAGRPPEIRVYRRDNSNIERFRADTIEKLLYGFYRHSKAGVQFASGAHHGSHLGASCFDIVWDVDKQMPRFREVHPGSVLVVQGVDEPMEFARSYRFWNVSAVEFQAEYGDTSRYGALDLSAAKADPDGSDRITIVEMCDRSRRVRFTKGLTLFESDHGLGFVPLVVIPNLGPVEEIWGYGDYEFIRGLAAYYEAVVSRMADAYRTTANGAMLEKGTGQTAPQIKKALRSGGVIPSRKDGAITPIEMAHFGPEIAEHLRIVRDGLNDIGFSPPAAWGTLGASSSGADRALQLGPQIELTVLKQLHWSAGLQRLNAMALKMIETKTSGRALYRGQHGYRCSPFALVLDAATKENLEPEGDAPDIGADGLPAVIPTTPKALIDGDYDTDVSWNNRLDRDDPQFQLAELNKFSQGIQSLYTTLERLGFPTPEEEIKLIADEASKYPWIRDGVLKMIQMQLDQAGGGGGGDPQSQQGDISGAIAAATATGGSGFDALSRGLNGSSNGGGQTAAGVPGAPYGGA